METSNTEEMMIPAIAWPLPLSFFLPALINPMTDRIKLMSEVVPRKMIEANDVIKPTMHRTLVFCGGIAVMGATGCAGAAYGA